MLKSQEDVCGLVRDVAMESDETGLGLFKAEITGGKLGKEHVVCGTRLCKDIRAIFTFMFWKISSCILL